MAAHLGRILGECKAGVRFPMMRVWLHLFSLDDRESSLAPFTAPRTHVKCRVPLPVFHRNALNEAEDLTVLLRVLRRGSPPRART